MKFGENNVLCPKYIDIYEFFWDTVGTYKFHHAFFVYYSQKLKKYKSMTYIPKSNSTSVWFKTVFPRMNNKNFTKRGPKGPYFFTKWV